ncbi:MAG TPA: hypothetical protein VJ842_06775 [Pyrinomonadaceae bacterium]|nr:hypothetical protein [Pyrinomonadaceae bacterium]
MHARTFSWNARTTVFYLFIAILSPAILSGCSAAGHGDVSTANTPHTTRPEALATLPPPPSSSPTPAASVVASASSPPQPAEVEAVIARVYQTAVRTDARSSASVLTGDFNGDDSQDIAIIVKPNREQLSEINSEFSNWIVEDPRLVRSPSLAARVDQGATPPPPRAQVEAGDTLLAIIHGFRSEGWRNAAAKQTYLLKNAVGTEMRTQTGAEARKMIKAQAAAHRLPYMRGDLIWQVLDGKAGCLYWTGAKYGWYDQTYYRQAAKAKDNNIVSGQ